MTLKQRTDESGNILVEIYKGDLNEMQYENDKYKKALEQIAKHPSLRSEELGYSGCRELAKAALT